MQDGVIYDVDFNNLMFDKTSGTLLGSGTDDHSVLTTFIITGTFTETTVTFKKQYTGTLTPEEVDIAKFWVLYEGHIDGNIISGVW